MDKRPDPDQLLKQVQAEEQAAQRGKLKIFFGACAGVGKTYAMLEAARRHKADGEDVVVGLVETHGRKETEALLQGLEVLPRREVEYHGTRLKAFDLDAALVRHPKIVLLDELAHTNEPGCRHAKRWQDVWELLDRGIDVYTTLNVQHLESINDIVVQITGVTVRETVPDPVFERADEVELVDLPPDDLLRRFEEGKIYMPDQAKQALQNFFSRSNLAALRESALRTAADRINAQVRQYRQIKGVQAPWATNDRLLVCVGPSHSSLHLIRAAHRLSKLLEIPWIGVYVETPAELRLPESARARVVQYLRMAEQLGAETVTLSGDNLADEILTFARTRNVTTIVIGRPQRFRWKRFVAPSPVGQLIRGSGDIHIYLVPPTEHHAKSEPFPRLKKPGRPSDYLFALEVVVGVSFLNGFLALILDPPNLVMIYLLGIMVVASRAGLGPSIAASFLSVVAFDFFLFRRGFHLRWQILSIC